jgi:hypothetical protein
MVGMLKRFPVNVIWALAVQFLLGTYVSMYVEFPENASIQEMWDFAGGNVWIDLHMLLGIIILIGVIAYLVGVVRKKQMRLLGYAIWGLASVLLAFIAGESFVSLQDDLYSMLMAVGFISAILAYCLAARVPVDVRK